MSGNEEIICLSIGQSAGRMHRLGKFRHRSVAFPPLAAFLVSVIDIVRSGRAP